MSTFVVTRDAGPAWTPGGIYEQPGVNEHATFMNELAGEGFVLFGGPLAGTERGRVRVLLVVEADSEEAIHDVEPWKILVGELAPAGRRVAR
jgi:hypothetical protein